MAYIYVSFVQLWFDFRLRQQFTEPGDLLLEDTRS